MNASVLKFWRDYLKSLPSGLREKKMPADVFAFGDSREMADELAMLVRNGVKTATCSALDLRRSAEAAASKRGLFCRYRWKPHPACDN